MLSSPCVFYDAEEHGATTCCLFLRLTKGDHEMKTRLDKLLLQRGLVPSRERAQALILAGRVLVNEQKIEKAGANVDENAELRILCDDLPFVSRGGLKLARALEHWDIDVR